MIGQDEDDDEETLADSIVDSMHSCVDSAEDTTLHEDAADAEAGDTDLDDEDFFAEDQIQRLRRMRQKEGDFFLRLL